MLKKLQKTQKFFAACGLGLVASALILGSAKKADTADVTQQRENTSDEVRITLMTAITMLRTEMPEGYKVAKILGLNVDQYGTNRQWSLVACHGNGDWQRFDIDSHGVKQQPFTMRLQSLDCATAPDLLAQHIADSPGVMEMLEAARLRAGLPSDGLASTMTTDLVVIDGQPQHIWRISGREINNYVAQLGGGSFRVGDVELTTCDQLEAVYNIQLSGCGA